MYGRILEEEKEHKEREEQQQASQQLNILKQSKPMGYRDRSAHGQWTCYNDKFGGKIFYYNKVTRLCQFDEPEDFDRKAWPKDGNGKLIVEKSAIFGLSFYH